MDTDIDQVHQINDITMMMLKQINGKDSIEIIADQLVSLYDWPRKQVLNDLLSLIHTLNYRYLINIKNPMKGRIKIKEIIMKLFFFLGTIQGDQWFMRKRYSLKCHPLLTIWRIFIFFCTSYLIAFMFIIFFVITILFIFDRLTPVSLLLTVAPVVMSMTIHEYCHYLFYQLLDTKNRTPYLGYALGKAQIVRTPLPFRNDLMVTLMGPLIPVIIGSFIILIGLFSSTNIEHIILAGSIFCSHIMFLIPPCHDGKRIFRMFMQHVIRLNH
ncbi:hypothetical protein J416_14051 [Gracilibacillus halophilus YIM-C55.5]|uniref:DUF3267 domain-containing protein n=1 Tax=Gracilibacillus halophilus YIM-C55.5 TaxID=1308866 RepID=N4WRK3_9BACI|nr:PqqD family protein [Gracilibacillus halophilus]ENH95841.1 hypothetical protein J416_14051 [Gracilibacillus halophilus YIM-C55.5]